MAVNAEDSAGIVLPVITSKMMTLDGETCGHENWSVSFYEEHSGLFLDEAGEWRSAVVEILSGHVIVGRQADYRESIVLECVPLLASFFSGRREILFCSARADRELFLIETVEDRLAQAGQSAIPGDTVRQDYINLKKYIRRIVSLDAGQFPSVIEKLTERYGLPDLLYDNEFEALYKDSMQTAEILVGALNGYKPSLFERATDYGLHLTANFALLRIHLLKFLAILPSLEYDGKGRDVKRLFLESMRRLVSDSRTAKRRKRIDERKPIPTHILIFSIIASLAASMTPAAIFAFIVRRIVKSFARRFIAGETISDANKSLYNLCATNRDATIDQLGELVVSEKEADIYCRKVIAIINGLAAQIQKGARNGSGILRANVSVKVSALSSDFKPEAPEYSYESAAPRLRQILLAARAEEVFINIDAEQYRCRGLIFGILKRVINETDELRNFGAIGIAVQAYLRDAYPHLIEIMEFARERGVTMPVRLVKGAYWDAETIAASAFNYDAPEFLNKEETDLHFRQLIIVILRNYPHVQLCIASHNLYDHCFADAFRRLHRPRLPMIEHQCLYMTCESLSVSMANSLGWVTRNYVPVGSMLMGMGYLVRRIMENSSMAGVLTMMRSRTEVESYLRPDVIFKATKRRGGIIHDNSITILSSRFTNTAPVRLYVKEQLDSVTRAMHSFKTAPPGEYNTGCRLNGRVQDIYSPSAPEAVVGRIKFASSADVTAAVKTSADANRAGSWARLRPVVRSSMLLKAADTLLLRRCELAALIVYEAGKTVSESIADVDEAIDFLRFYARQEVVFTSTCHNAVPRGVFVVVSPWNFPLAIPCGMAAAALAAGNTVIIKSSKHTPLIVQLLVDILHNSGIPEDVLIHIPGPGDEIGEILTNDQRVSGVVFTGSKDVGIKIARQAGMRMVASPRHDDFRYPVRVITEMGGKNAIIITANAELDETVSSAIYSCFGHAGQKCSAASRILVDERILGRFETRFSEACADIRVGESHGFATSINPVISEDARMRLRQYGYNAIGEALEYGGAVLLDRMDDGFPGHCVGPLVLRIPAELAIERESYAQKELFGPIVHIIPYKGLEEAVSIVNSAEYALTAGVFSQSQDDIDFIVERVEAGNIYVNRGCTGARVGVEPFGGFKLSGTGPKAGHHDYLAAFHVCITDEHEQSRDERKTAHDAGWAAGQPRTDSPSEEPINKIAKRISLPTERTVVRTLMGGMEQIIENFDNIAHNPHISDKANLIAFAKWIESSLETFMTSGCPNISVPGQLSYNSYSMIKTEGVVISGGKLLNKNTLYNFVSALAVGAGITVLASSPQVYGVWKTVCGWFESTGMPLGVVRPVMVDKAAAGKELADSRISFAIIDGDNSFVQDAVHSFAAMHIDDQTYMRSIHLPSDTPSPPHWEEYIKQFIFTRSVAVNTMRHGAPFEIDGENSHETVL